MTDLEPIVTGDRAQALAELEQRHAQVKELERSLVYARMKRLDAAERCLASGSTVTSLAKALGMRRETLSLLLKIHREVDGRE